MQREPLTAAAAGGRDSGKEGGPGGRNAPPGQTSLQAISAQRPLHPFDPRANGRSRGLACWRGAARLTNRLKAYHMSIAAGCECHCRPMAGKPSGRSPGGVVPPPPDPPLLLWTSAVLRGSCCVARVRTGQRSRPRPRLKSECGGRGPPAGGAAVEPEAPKAPRELLPSLNPTCTCLKEWATRMRASSGGTDYSSPFSAGEGGIVAWTRAAGREWSRTRPRFGSRATCSGRLCSKQLEIQPSRREFNASGRTPATERVVWGAEQ